MLKLRLSVPGLSCRSTLICTWPEVGSVKPSTPKPGMTSPPPTIKILVRGPGKSDAIRPSEAVTVLAKGTPTCLAADWTGGRIATANLPFAESAHWRAGISPSTKRRPPWAYYVSR